MNFVFFFFSSRRRHTRLQGDWSSDVCSSDLISNDTQHKVTCSTLLSRIHSGDPRRFSLPLIAAIFERNLQGVKVMKLGGRSEERRVGKECRSRWSPYH